MAVNGHEPCGLACAGRRPAARAARRPRRPSRRVASARSRRCPRSEASHAATGRATYPASAYWRARASTTAAPFVPAGCHPCSTTMAGRTPAASGGNRIPPSATPSPGTVTMWRPAVDGGDTAADAGAVGDLQSVSEAANTKSSTRRLVIERLWDAVLGRAQGLDGAWRGRILDSSLDRRGCSQCAAAAPLSPRERASSSSPVRTRSP